MYMTWCKCRHCYTLYSNIVHFTMMQRTVTGCPCICFIWPASVNFQWKSLVFFHLWALLSLKSMSVEPKEMDRVLMAVSLAIYIPHFCLDKASQEMACNWDQPLVNALVGRHWYHLPRRKQWTIQFSRGHPWTQQCCVLCLSYFLVGLLQCSLCWAAREDQLKVPTSTESAANKMKGISKLTHMAPSFFLGGIQGTDYYLSLKPYMAWDQIICMPVPKDICPTTRLDRISMFLAFPLNVAML